MLAFSSLGSVSSSGVEGLGLLRKVNVKVLTADLQSVVRPVEGALVVIGDRRAVTSSDGTATVSLPPGRYSSYFKHPDPRFSVVVRELKVERDLASTPVIFGYSSDGEFVRLASTPDDFSYFSTSLRPGERNLIAFEVHGGREVAVLLPSSYLPIQLVRVTVS
jgi:hypothetical protein